MSALRGPVLTAAVVLAGLQAGTYFTWATGVMPGLARVDDRTFVQTMQEVNVAIVNPVFMLTFVGAPLLAAVAIATSGPDARPWAVAATVLAVGTVVITVAGNVPLNDALASASWDAASSAREAFEASWVRLNIARALTSAGAVAALGVAALRA